MKIVHRSVVLGATALVAAAWSMPARAQEGGEWEWMVAPYAWGVSFGTDLETTQPPDGGISNDTNFDDVLDKFDGAFQVHIEGQNETWGMFADFTYLGLADENEYERFHTESDLDARLFELAAVWSPGEERWRGLDVFAGLRYIDVDLTVQFQPDNPLFDGSTVDGGDSFSDFMVGARYTWQLSERWGVTLRGDGSFGDTEGTWNTSAVATLRMKRGAWLFGYRYLSVELETGASKTDLTMGGPMIGYGFIF
ncbi:MAG: hypothetical protein ABWY31_08685 [Pseudoxanthomonas sp.]